MVNFCSAISIKIFIDIVNNGIKATMSNTCSNCSVVSVFIIANSRDITDVIFVIPCLSSSFNVCAFTFFVVIKYGVETTRHTNNDNVNMNEKFKISSNRLISNSCLKNVLFSDFVDTSIPTVVETIA